MEWKFADCDCEVSVVMSSVISFIAEQAGPCLGIIHSLCFPSFYSYEIETCCCYGAFPTFLL